MRRAALGFCFGFRLSGIRGFTRLLGSLVNCFYKNNSQAANIAFGIYKTFGLGSRFFLGSVGSMAKHGGGCQN